jgi:predicted MFS family arabinose efflux permease
LPDTERVRDVRFDIWGSLTLGLGALMMLTGVNQGPKWGWASPAVVLLLVGSVGVLILFVRIERRVSDPLMPLRWMRTRNFVVPVASQAFANFAYMGGLLLSPLVMSEILGYDSGRISLVIIARPLTFALLAPLASLATIRVGERLAAMFGWSCILASMLAFMLVDESSGVMLMVAALALSGAGFGIAGPALTSLVANSVDERDLGVAGAMQQLVNQMGSVFGSVVMTTIQVATLGAGLETSYHVTFAVAAAVAGVAVMLAAFVRPTPRTA